MSFSNQRSSSLFVLLLIRISENNVNKDMKDVLKPTESSVLCKRTLEFKKEKTLLQDMMLSIKLKRQPWTLLMTASEMASTYANKLLK